MLRLKRFAGHLIAVLVPVLLVITLTSGPMFAEDAATPGENSSEANSPPEANSPEENNPEENNPEAEDVFAIPEGTDAETLQEFLNVLTRTPAAERTPAGFRAHFSKLYEISQEILARDIDDETSLLAIAIVAGSLDILDQFGDQTAADRKFEFVDKLKQSDRPALAARGRMLDVLAQISRLDTDDKAAIRAMIGQVAQFLQEKPLTIDHGRLVYRAVSAIEQTGDPELITSAAQTFAKSLKASDDPRLSGLAVTIEGTARRLTLKGNPLEIAGQTVTGDDFNIDDWKGKVVIVDFWATWCGPCVASMPELVQLYEDHHAQGLEIIGISLDDNRTQLESFLEQKEIPWPTIFTDPEGKEAWDNPLATYYGVSAIPTVFLVGRDGNVVATDLYGKSLHEAVIELVNAK